MSTVLASTIIDRAAILLQDTTNIRWTRAELLAWLNDGQRDIAVHKPNACVTNTARQLVAGSKQTLAADAVSLVDAVRNLGANGTTPGRAVRLVSREILDSQIPDWHAATPAAEVKHFVYSELDPHTFYVYPPSTGANQLELICTAAPATVSEDAAIALDDIYANALLDYMLYRAYAKDTEYASNPTASANHYTAYGQAIKGKLDGEAAGDPNRRVTGNGNLIQTRTK